MKLLKETEYAKYLQEISCTDCIKKNTPILPTPKISPNACISNYADDTQVRNEHYTDYIACQSDLKVMYGHWCRPDFKSGHQLYYLPIFRKRLRELSTKNVELCTLYLVKHWMETCQGNISRIVCLNLHQVNELANLVRKIWQLPTSCLSEAPLLWNTNIVKRNKVWSRKSYAYCIIWIRMINSFSYSGCNHSLQLKNRIKSRNWSLLGWFC